MAAGRLVRVAAVIALTVLSQCVTAPPAAAGRPPPIDNSLLPAAAPAAPTRPTAQRESCAVPALDTQRGDLPTQFDSLDLPAVWSLTRGEGQRVAVIDTGVSPHRRLPRLVGGGDYVFTGDGTQDCDGHGTLVAGIIAAAPDSNTDRFSGIAPAATVIGIRQSSVKFGAISDPAATGVGDVETLAAAVRTAADLGASVINISSVACAPVADGLDDRALGAALAYAAEVKNAVVVAAAGNTGAGQSCPAQAADATWSDATVAVSPAWYDDYVLTVGSVDADGVPSEFTMAGPWVDVAAPGEAVLSLSPVGDAMANAVAGTPGAAAIYGTSYAAPVVAGVAALIRSRFPTWTPRQVMDRITSTAHHPLGGRNGLIGNGVVDPLAAVSTTATASTGPAPDGGAAASPAPAPAPAPDAHGRRTALNGAGAVLGLLALVLGARTALARSGRSRQHIAGD